MQLFIGLHNKTSKLCGKFIQTFFKHHYENESLELTSSSHHPVEFKNKVKSILFGIILNIICLFTILMFAIYAASWGRSI